jgi:hypothetical protein
MRICLRERNTLAMLIKCYGGIALAVFGPLTVLQTLLTSAALLALRRPRTAADLLTGLGWNLRQLPRTLELRRAVQATRRRSDRDILGRMYLGWRRAAVVLHVGLPDVEEGGPLPLEQAKWAVVDFSDERGVSDRSSQR